MTDLFFRSMFKSLFFSTLKLRVKGLFLKRIAERPECFQSPVFTRMLYFKTESSLTFKFEDDLLFFFLPSVYLFCTCILFLLSPARRVYLKKSKALILSSQNACFRCPSVLCSTFFLV